MSRADYLATLEDAAVAPEFDPCRCDRGTFNYILARGMIVHGECLKPVGANQMYSPWCTGCGRRFTYKEFTGPEKFPWCEECCNT